MQQRALVRSSGATGGRTRQFTLGTKITLASPSAQLYSVDVLSVLPTGMPAPPGAIAVSRASQNGRDVIVYVAAEDFDQVMNDGLGELSANPMSGSSYVRGSNVDSGWPICFMSGSRARTGGAPLDTFRGINLEQIGRTYARQYDACSDVMTNGGYSITISLTGLVYPFTFTFLAQPGVTDFPHYFRFKMARNQFTPNLTRFSVAYYLETANAPVPANKITLPYVEYPLGAMSMIDQLIWGLPRVSSIGQNIKPTNAKLANIPAGVFPLEITLLSAPEQGTLTVDIPADTEAPIQAIREILEEKEDNQRAISALRARMNNILVVQG